ncbi:MAG: alpha/beta fold hydrolase, partial [Bdellovibrionota bacterium]
MKAPESIFVTTGESKLHLRHFFPANSDSVSAGHTRVAFCVHGAIENGRIFYSAKNHERGFAPYLARLGFHVYVADLGGRGQSTPPIQRGSAYSQNATITAEIPAMVRAIRERHPEGTEETWVSHSWGGVLLHAVLARYPELRKPVHAEIFFSTKRSITVWNLERLIKITLGWYFIGPWLVRRHGYLPARERGWGSDNETRETLRES